MPDPFANFRLIRSLLSIAMVNMLLVSASAILEKPWGLYIGNFGGIIDRVTIRNASGIAPGYTATISWS